MRHEYEAKFLSIDVAGLQATLRALGAAQAFPRRLLTRKIFESGALEGAPGFACATKASGPRSP
jgi:adenylate cyclase class 2